MIYVDSSVVLAQLLAEDRFPDPSFWDDDALVASRLLEYEVWNRINARALAQSHANDLRLILARLAFLELDAPCSRERLTRSPRRSARSTGCISRRSSSLVG